MKHCHADWIKGFCSKFPKGNGRQKTLKTGEYNHQNIVILATKIKTRVRVDQFGLVLWQINHCRLFNAKHIFYSFCVLFTLIVTCLSLHFRYFKNKSQDKWHNFTNFIHYSYYDLDVFFGYGLTIVIFFCGLYTLVLRCFFELSSITSGLRQLPRHVTPFWTN